MNAHLNIIASTYNVLDLKSRLSIYPEHIGALDKRFFFFPTDFFTHTSLMLMSSNSITTWTYLFGMQLIFKILCIICKWLELICSIVSIFRKHNIMNILTNQKSRNSF